MAAERSTWHRWDKEPTAGSPARCTVCGAWKYAEPGVLYTTWLYAPATQASYKTTKRPHCKPPTDAQR